MDHRPRTLRVLPGGVSTMSGLIAIDPGARSGFARFDPDGRLIHACTITRAKLLADPPSVPVVTRYDVVIEKPVIYPMGRGKGDPNDLITLAIMVGDLFGYYTRAGAEVQLVAPRTWKGTVPKAIHGRRILAALTARERGAWKARPRAKTPDHNMLDAIGLGLWWLKKEGTRTT